MSSWAVIERELRVQSRLAWMPWWRVAAGAIAALQLAIVLPWLEASSGSVAGQTLLSLLGWMAWALCAVVGIALTADSLSREQREGTLPLLFLTELRGMDVVLGKFAATTLPSFYCLLAVFPVMAIALPAGGVTSGEFWRTQLALVDTLFFSVSSGLLASACHDAHSDAVRAALRSFLVWSICPFIALMAPWLPVCSPAAAMVFAADSFCRSEPWKYWSAIGSVAAVAGFQLWLAGRQLKRRVVEPKDSAATDHRAAGGGEPRMRPSPALHAQPQPAGRVGDEPANWLASRVGGIGAFVATGILLPAVGTVLTRFTIASGPTATWLGLNQALHLLLPYTGALLLVAGAGRFFGEARRNGSLELLMCTPLATASLIQEAWLRIRRSLWLGGAVSMVLWVLEMVGTLATFRNLFGAGQCLVLGLSAGLRLYTAVVVCRLAVWFSAAQPRAGLAISAPLVLAMVLPTIATYLIGSIAGLFIPRVVNGTPPFWFWLPWLVPALLEAAYLIWLDRWTRDRLAGHLREAVAGDGPGIWPWTRAWKRKEKPPGGARERT